MALGLLALLVAAVAAISVAGLLLMYLVRSETVKKYIFYIMAVWGMLISVVSAPSLPVNWIFMRAAAWAAGFLGISRHSGQHRRPHTQTPALRIPAGDHFGGGRSADIHICIK